MRQGCTAWYEPGRSLYSGSVRARLPRACETTLPTPGGNAGFGAGAGPGEGPRPGAGKWSVVASQDQQVVKSALIEELRHLFNGVLRKRDREPDQVVRAIRSEGLYEIVQDGTEDLAECSGYLRLQHRLHLGYLLPALFEAAIHLVADESGVRSVGAGDAEADPHITGRIDPE